MNPVMHSQGESPFGDDSVRMHTTVQAFNKALRSLLKQAQETWPDNKQVTKAYKKFKKIKQAYPVAPLRAFMTLVAPYEADIMTADSSYFAENVEVPGIDFKSLWAAADAEKQDRMITSLKTCYSVAKVQQSVPPNVMGTLEQSARECAQGFQSGQMNQGDVMGQIIQTSSKMVESMFGLDAEQSREMQQAMQTITGALGSGSGGGEGLGGLMELATSLLSNLGQNSQGAQMPSIVEPQQTRITNSLDEVD